jgi:hypothetical protein
MMIGAWVMLILLRQVADRSRLPLRVWHPGLFWFAVYMILLSAIVLVVAG